MNTLPKRNHEDSKYYSQFALRAILDFETFSLAMEDALGKNHAWINGHSERFTCVQ